MNFFSKAKFFKNICLANFSDKLSEPYKITLNISDRCNSRCSTCGIWKKQSSSELTPGEVEKIFCNLKTDWVNITGGEPFIKNDLVQICSVIRKEVNPAVLNFTTNGLLSRKIERKMREIIALNFSQIIITVSLDGPPLIHDKIRGVPGSWEKSVKTFKLLKLLSKNSNLKVFFGYTISKSNLGYFNETSKNVKKFVPQIESCDWHVNLFHLSSHYYNNLNCKISLNQRQLLHEIGQVRKIYNSRFNILGLLEKVFIKGTIEYIKTREVPLQCSALHSSCYIDSECVVYPCIHYGEKLGELRNNNYDLLEIWNSFKSGKIRANIIKKKCPKCWTACEANPSILNNIFKKSIKWMFQLLFQH